MKDSVREKLRKESNRYEAKTRMLNADFIKLEEVVNNNIERHRKIEEDREESELLVDMLRGLVK
ncbi:MAG: hypothetical protein M1148_02925 [Candidatus Thermoplasmatota archaeon]|nr:hypothetical protein [Candidatus Thermoplasmatota archaeon]